MLAQFLTSDTGSNFVITTNFDTLTEDSLFIFTDKKPLVINHEALAEFANNPNIKRPIVAKIHRGLFFDPLNTPKETKGLKGNWAAVLTSIFSIYTPIVIGYGGGDKSLMKLLKNKNVRMKNGIYWCYYEGGEFPDEKIQKLVKNKNGYFVKTAGFDAVMLAIGNEMFKNEIMPNYVKKYLDDRNTEIYNKYIDLIKQKDTINQTTGSGKEFKKEIEKLDNRIDNRIKEAENQKDENKELTAWDYLLKGFSASEANETDKAIEYYSKAIELKPDYAEAYNNRGNIFAEKKQYDKALEDYSKAIELKPDYAKAFCNRGITYSEMKQYDKALEAYSKAIEYKSDYAEAYNNRGNIFAEKKQYDKALEDYSKAIELKQDFAEAFCNRGSTHNELKQYDKALEDYSKAIELKPDYAKAYNNRGGTYTNMKQYDRALEDYSKAIELKPDYANAYNNRGITYDKMKQYNKALEDYSKAIELKQDFAGAYNNRGYTYLHLIRGLFKSN